MITSRINLADIQDNEKIMLSELFNTFNHTDVFNKDEEFVIEYENPTTKEMETHSIILSHDIVRRERSKVANQFRYEVVNHDKLLGKGSFGSVYEILCTLANDNNNLIVKTDKKRVVKIQTVPEQYLGLLKAEAVISQKAGNLHLKNPTLIKTGEKTYLSYLVMKKLNGTDLYKIITQQARHLLTLPVHRRLTICMYLLEKIIQMHDKGIVHRDLKPDNVMLELNDKELEIFDFGLSKLATEDDAGDLLGTPGFIPLEAYMNKGTTEKSDIFAVAIIIGMLWNADQPGDNMQDIIDYKFENIFNEEDVPSKDRIIDLNDAEKRLILETLYKMTRFERDHRCNAKEALDDFTEIRDQYVNRQIAEMAASRPKVYKLKHGLFFDNHARDVSEDIDLKNIRHSY